MDKIRGFLIEHISQTGGHLASNLGIVELTLALHQVYDPYVDRIIWDVGHQTYVHKMLTGREAQFVTLREFGGMSGFPKPSESPADAFIAGHASNSVSVALGMARARDLIGETYEVAAVIGDGALTGGLAYEGLSNAGQSGVKITVILNDNGMSISRSVGSIAPMLKRLSERPGYYNFKRAFKSFCEVIPGGNWIYKLTHNVKTKLKRLLLPSGANLFEDLGFRYLGPVDGHDIKRLTFFLDEAKRQTAPTLIHVLTKKGKGYPPAEDDPNLYHGVPPFDPEVGLEAQSGETFSDVFGKLLTDLAETNEKIVAITAAMADGTGLAPFAERFPKRFFDDGITEAHSLTMAAGMAARGIRPVFAVYSAFFQRAYDSLIHDVAVMSLPVVLGIDRAGIVGEDGETHHGLYDSALLMSVPNIEVYCPSNFAELRECLTAALEQSSRPIAIRYPRGGELPRVELPPIAGLPSLTVVSYGIMTEIVRRAISLSGVPAEFFQLICVKGEYSQTLKNIAESVKSTGSLAVIEDVAAYGSVGERLLAELTRLGVSPEKVLLRNAGTEFVAHGSISDLRKLLRLDAESIAEDLQRL
jgi:1-deoxy-D-xylulose-5-phosphate synthase